MDLDVQRPFFAAFGADKKPCCMYPTFHFFSTEGTAAMQTHMKVQEPCGRAIGVFHCGHSLLRNLVPLCLLR
ncbi:MAG: hypothetical protein BGO25_19940 [Acidobacteriales bacterium 59-55]|nr:MAG: hypothetical protein BGO25_19940 [Acidobacteriales bacterium 59-55]